MSQSRRDAILAEETEKYMERHGITSYDRLTPAREEDIRELAEAREDW